MKRAIAPVPIMSLSYLDVAPPDDDNAPWDVDLFGKWLDLHINGHHPTDMDVTLHYI